VSDSDKVFYINGETGQPEPGPPSRQRSPKVPMTASEAMQMRPEDLPAFTAVAATVDRYMARVPWWLVAGGSVALTWYVLRKR